MVLTFTPSRNRVVPEKYYDCRKILKPMYIANNVNVVLLLLHVVHTVNILEKNYNT